MTWTHFKEAALVWATVNNRRDEAALVGATKTQLYAKRNYLRRTGAYDRHLRYMQYHGMLGLDDDKLVTAYQHELEAADLKLLWVKRALKAADLWAGVKAAVDDGQTGDFDNEPPADWELGRRAEKKEEPEDVDEGELPGEPEDVDEGELPGEPEDAQSRDERDRVAPESRPKTCREHDVELVDTWMKVKVCPHCILEDLIKREETN